MLFQSNSICPICAAPGDGWCIAQDWEYRTSADKYDYLKCPQCGTIFLRELEQVSLHSIYPPNYYSFSGKASSTVFQLKDWWDRRFFRSLLKKLPFDSLAVLDVGGGTGEVLDTLKKADSRIEYTEIIDIDSNAKSQAMVKGHVYCQTTIENYTSHRQFHVILLLNIIEHVANPAEIIGHCGKMLAQGGIIIIKTPNVDSLDARLFKHHYWGGLHCPRHWILFSEFSLRTMVRSTNLQIRKLVYTQAAPFWVWSIINLARKKDIYQHKKPLIEHPLFGILSVFFAAFDIIRSSISKTSQMFIVLTGSE